MNYGTFGYVRHDEAIACMEEIEDVPRTIREHVVIPFWDDSTFAEWISVCQDTMTETRLSAIREQLEAWDYVPSAQCIMDVFPNVGHVNALRIKRHLQKLKLGRVVYQRRQRFDALQRLMLADEQRKHIECLLGETRLFRM